MMKTLSSLALAALIAGPANAACVAEYKAKQDNPLKLFYGTMKVDGPCTADAVVAKLSARLSSKGQTLLKVLSVEQK